MTTDKTQKVDERTRRLIVAMAAERTLLAVLVAFRGANIACAPVKGVVLARWIYDDVRERPYADVDILIPRGSFAAAVTLVKARGWQISYQSVEMGEVLFTIDHMAVELHAEVGRPELSRMTVAGFIARAQPDSETFALEILRIDDVDHLLLLVANVVKDGFTYANAHQPADLERMLRRLRPRWQSVVDSASDAGFLTALHTVAEWMIAEHASEGFAAFRKLLPRDRRVTFASAVCLNRRLTTRQSDRLGSPGGMTGLILAVLTPDDVPLRLRGVLRVLRRGVWSRLGWDPG